MISWQGWAAIPIPSTRCACIRWMSQQRPRARRLNWPWLIRRGNRGRKLLRMERRCSRSPSTPSQCCASESVITSLSENAGFLPTRPEIKAGTFCWYQSSTMVYNVVKKVSVAMFIGHLAKGFL